MMQSYPTRKTQMYYSKTLNNKDLFSTRASLHLIHQLIVEFPFIFNHVLPIGRKDQPIVIMTSSTSDKRLEMQLSQLLPIIYHRKFFAGRTDSGRTERKRMRKLKQNLHRLKDV
uniref:Uncharacterized protein n=1 Tax=Onchocerca volvulus TaxID=6282 RepID=A0A8R1TNE3_ONCVO